MDNRTEIRDISVDYYTRLERGNLGGAPDGVLAAFARAMQLDDAERAHLFDQAGPAQMPAAADCAHG
jgi:hypothetical protein